MKRVLVLGGYGAFGSGVCERLHALGFTVLVAGRNLAKAEAFAAGRPGFTPVVADREGDLAGVLRQHRPWLLVDAAGPFQGLALRAPEACLAAGVHYVDFADARDFVVRVRALDARARAAGVALVSGASSVPALSGAVVRSLAADLDRVTAIEASISASNRATVGPSVVTAILSYVGRPFPLWRGRRWETVHGWSDLRRVVYAVPGWPPLGPRLVAQAEVPDLDLLPASRPERPAVTFRAGAEFGLQNRALQLLGALVRRRPSLDPRRLAPALIAARRLTAGIGGDRSAMAVAVYGLKAGARLERRWTLDAEQGCGPQLPCLAAPLVAAAIAEGRIGPGASDASALLDLADFEPAFATLPVHRAVDERQHPPPPHARVMGERFNRLPPLVRAVHAGFGDSGFAGEATVTRGRHPLARLAARVFGFPPAGERVPVHVRFTDEGAETRWTRDFAGRTFASAMRTADGLLIERFGPLRFGFALDSEPEGLAMRLQRWRLGPLPLPRFLAPGGTAREWEADRRFHFDVPIRLPLAGLVVHYRGWLQPL